jgi:hypothetical protein
MIIGSSPRHYCFHCINCAELYVALWLFLFFAFLSLGCYLSINLS